MFRIMFDNFVCMFNVVCWTTSAILIVYWAYLFNLNEDLSTIDNRKFYQGPFDVFPVLSLCFKDPFPEAKLANFGENINASTYVKYYQGSYFEKTLQNIEYQNVVMDIAEYVDELYIKWKNGSYNIVSQEVTL